jgi:hypothetical protein
MQANILRRFNKNILIAVDMSENARRAVAYVGRLAASAASTSHCCM